MTKSITDMQMSRRRFLRNSALATVVTALGANALGAQTAFASSGAAAPSAVANAATFSMSAQVPAGDLDILNYALTLEHLEAYAYVVANGSGLLSGYAATYFKTIGEHEATHVDTLTKTINSLGGTPVKALASYNLPKLNSEQEMLTYFHAVEELGAAAYLGQAPRLVTADLITAAVSIHNVEAQHAAVLSHLIGVSPAPAFGTPKTMEEVLAVVTPLLMPAGSMPQMMPATGGGGMRPHGRGLTAF